MIGAEGNYWRAVHARTCFHVKHLALNEIQDLLMCCSGVEVEERDGKWRVTIWTTLKITRQGDLQTRRKVVQLGAVLNPRSDSW